MDPLFSETTTRLSFEGVSHVHSKKFSHTHELEEDVLKSQCLEKASQKQRQGSGDTVLGRAGCRKTPNGALNSRILIIRTPNKVP